MVGRGKRQHSTMRQAGIGTPVTGGFDDYRLLLHNAIKEAFALEATILGQIGLTFVEHAEEIMLQHDISPTREAHAAVTESRLCLVGMGDNARCFSTGQMANKDVPSDYRLHHCDAAWRLTILTSGQGKIGYALTAREALCHLEALAFSTSYIAGRAMPGVLFPLDRDAEVLWQLKYVQKLLSELRFLDGQAPSGERLRTSLLASP